MDVSLEDSQAFVDALEEFALSLPETWPDEPWGDRCVKVGKKIVVFLSRPESERAVMTAKLPESAEHALSFPEATPTGYGLGKHGWVTIYVDRIEAGEREVLFDFVEESYRAVATKTLVKRLDAELAEHADD